MKFLEALQVTVRDISKGRLIRRSQLGLRIEIFIQQIVIFFEELMGRGKKNGNGGIPPWAGKLAPVRPRPPHHLIAARDLPPSERTHLFPRD